MAEQMKVDTLSHPTQAQQDIIATPPDLLTHHVYITFFPNKNSTLFVGSLAERLSTNVPPYVVKTRKITDAADDETVTNDMRKSLKVIMILSKEYLNATDQYEVELNFIEKLTDERREEVLVPVLMELEYKDLPARLREGPAIPNIGPTEKYPQTGEQFLKDIVNRIGEKRPIHHPKTTGTGYALAYGHYFGYYFLVLQGLGERIKQTTADRTHWNCGTDAEVIPLMFVVIPKTGYPKNPSLSALDPDIVPVLSVVDNKPIKAKYTMDMAGHPDKDYSNPLFCITFDHKEYVFAAEIPTTLKTLREMKNASFVNDFSQSNHDDELMRFHGQMKRILATQDDKYAEARRQALVIIEYDDTNPTPSLRDEIGREIGRRKLWNQNRY